MVELAAPLSSVLSTLSTHVPYELFTYKILMINSSCGTDCSGHGECRNGTCLCEVQYEGGECDAPNLSYYIAFATIFFIVALISMVQLIMCIHADFQRMKAPTVLRAFRITTQKLLYFLVFIAATLRGAYFSSPSVAENWSSSLLSAYYPVLLSGSSLIVCFWAEVFHLRDIHCERPQFLSKSFLGFLTFNIISYSLLLAEFAITSHVYTEEEKSFYVNLFKGCYGVLMFIVVIFFLIYGVEVFFKVRGGFLCSYDTIVAPVVHNNRTPFEGHMESSDPASSVGLINRQVRGGFAQGPPKTINTSQLHQSRLGLISQAVMLLTVICFLFSDILGELWRKKVDLMSRNFHDVIFRVVEIGVALWFPCVLWNCLSPEQLWILNPKNILKRLEHGSVTPMKEEQDKATEKFEISGAAEDTVSERQPECWICYDSDRTDAGAMIHPCHCRGDMGAVHHDCLRRWLVESADNPDNLQCKVCQVGYQVQKGSQFWLGQGFTTRHWLQTAVIVTSMCSSAAGAWAVIQLYDDTLIRMVAVGVAVLMNYICLRFLGLNTVTAYQRAKVSAVKILGHRLGSPIHGQGHVSIISDTVVELGPSSGMPRMQEARI